jgi:hypothetical protein
MKEIRPRKLSLGKETLRRLDPSSLRAARGATMAPSGTWANDTTGTCPDPTSAQECSEYGCGGGYTSVVIPWRWW